jgi:nicotinamide-nucleotide amidase
VEGRKARVKTSTGYHRSVRPVIETLATGDEVVNGDVADTNSAYASRLLAASGLLVSRHTAVPDDHEMIVAELKEIARRADLCVCSGGLGPTEDDLTPDAAAEALGVAVDVDEEAVRRMKARFAASGYRFTENNRRSARVPKGAEVYQNEVGTAPAFGMQLGRCRFFFLPGVPSEHRFFVDGAVLDWARAQWQGGFGAVRQLKTLGWGESHLAEQFADFAGRFPDVKLGYRAHAPEVWVKFTAEAGSREEALELLEPALAEARRRIGETVFGGDGEELDLLVHEALLASKSTLATAESCTGGLVASLLTRHAGASAYFLGGFVTYSNDMKQRELGVPAGVLAAHGAVSAQTAEAMARGALERTGARLAVSITGIAGPDGGTPDKPVGLVFLGLADATGVEVQEKKYRGNRERIQKAAAAGALEMIRRRLGRPHP